MDINLEAFALIKILASLQKYKKAIQIHGYTLDKSPIKSPKGLYAFLAIKSSK